MSDQDSAKIGSPAPSLQCSQSLRVSRKSTLAFNDVVALIPAYNEAATIRDLVERTLKIVPNVVVVDDGSTDATAAQLKDLPVTLLRNPCNLGKSASPWRGFDFAVGQGARHVVTLDGDGQHLPEDIRRLMVVAERFPSSIVIGARLHDKKNSPLRRYYANLFARFGVSWAAGYPIADTQSGFRVYPVALLAGLGPREVSRKRFVLESEILIVAGRRGVRSIAVQIAGIYPEHMRLSHFRPVRDFAGILAMGVGRLLMRGMYPRRLWRSLTQSAAIAVVPERPESSGVPVTDSSSEKPVSPPHSAGS